MIAMTTNNSIRVKARRETVMVHVSRCNAWPDSAESVARSEGYAEYAVLSTCAQRRPRHARRAPPVRASCRASRDPRRRVVRRSRVEKWGRIGQSNPTDRADFWDQTRGELRRNARDNRRRRRRRRVAEAFLAKRSVHPLNDWRMTRVAVRNATRSLGLLCGLLGAARRKRRAVAAATTRVAVRGTTAACGHGGIRRRLAACHHW